MSFLAGLVAMVVFSYREGDRKALILNVVGALIVAFVLVINLARELPLITMSTSLLIAFLLYLLWVRKGRPRGIAGAGAE